MTAYMDHKDLANETIDPARIQEITDGAHRVLDLIAQTEFTSGREEGSVTLLAATKTRDVGEIMAAIDAGVHMIGENRPQEVIAKIDGLRYACLQRGIVLGASDMQTVARLDETDDPEALDRLPLHLIGQLQSNKIGKMLPDVVGMTQSDAVYVLESKGFAVHEEKIKSDDTEGVVLLMDPVAGSREEEGSEVTIHVSEARTIPDVAGKQRDEAAALLEKDGFEKVSFVTEKSNEREGLVLGIAPEAGSKAAAGTEITVTVAVPFTVPDVKGKTWDEASKMLTDEGYEPVASYVYDDSVPAGTVLGTTPEADAKADSGSTVTVSVALSRGAELEQAALSYLGGLRDSGSTVTVGGTAYLVESVDAVKYEGGETTSFTITGKAVTSLDGETVYGSSKQKSGAIVWTSDNAIASIS